MKKLQRPELSQRIERILSESMELRNRFFANSTDLIIEIVAQISEAIIAGHKVLLFGNGGSAADAQHIAAEFVNRYLQDRPGLPAIALTTDSSALTSIGNDIGFDYIFSRQIEALGKKGDVAVGITTSGNSPNVIHGLEKAKSMGLITVALTGRDGGKVGPLVQYLLNVPHQSTARVQEVHIMVGHIICQLVDEQVIPTLNK